MAINAAKQKFVSGKVNLQEVGYSGIGGVFSTIGGHFAGKATSKITNALKETEIGSLIAGKLAKTKELLSSKLKSPISSAKEANTGLKFSTKEAKDFGKVGIPDKIEPTEVQSNFNKIMREAEGSQNKVNVGQSTQGEGKAGLQIKNPKEDGFVGGSFSNGNGSTFQGGEFSIVKWDDYPTGISKPEGPFRFIEGAEYETARNAANKANQSLHTADPSLKGMQIHEIQPVKFGGSPTDVSNKVPLTPSEHAKATTWWRRLQRELEKK